MVQLLTFGFVLLVVMIVLQTADTQTCTICLSGGFCPCTHPQCCVYNGDKLCCRPRNGRSEAQLSQDAEKITEKMLISDDSAPRTSAALWAKGLKKP